MISSFTIKRFTDFRLAVVEPDSIQELGNVLENYLADNSRSLKKLVKAKEVVVYVFEDDDQPVASIETHKDDVGNYRVYKISGKGNKPPAYEYMQIIEEWFNIQSTPNFYFDSFMKLENGFYMIKNKNMFGIVDKELQIVLEPKYKVSSVIFMETMGIANGVNKKSEIRFWDGDDIILCHSANNYEPIKPTALSSKYEFFDNYAYHYKNGKGYIINRNGGKSKTYEQIFPDSGYFVVSKDKKFAIINDDFEQLTGFKFDEPPYFHAGKYYYGDEEIKLKTLDK